MGLKVCILGFLLATDLLSVPLPYFPGPECEWPSSLCSSDVLLHLFSLNFASIWFSVFCFSTCCVPPLFFSFLLLPHRLFMILLEFCGISMDCVSARLLECKTSFFCLLFVWQMNFPTTPHVFHIFLSVSAPFPSCWRCLGCIHRLSSFSSLSLPLLLKKRESTVLASSGLEQSWVMLSSNRSLLWHCKLRSLRVPGGSTLQVSQALRHWEVICGWFSVA